MRNRVSVVIWTTTPWTIPGNRAIAFSTAIAYGLYRVTVGAGRQLGDERRAYHSRRQARRATCFAAAKVEAFERLRRRRRDDLSASCLHPSRWICDAAMTFDVPLLDGDHVTDDAGTGFVHTAPGHGREDFDLWMARRRRLLARARHRHAHPLHRRRKRRLHRRRAGLRGQARPHRQGREGRRQRGGHQGADRGGRAGRARQAQAPVSPFLALEKTGHLPQHAAMVHRDGQADRDAFAAARRGAKGGDVG